MIAIRCPHCREIAVVLDWVQLRGMLLSLEAVNANPIAAKMLAMPERLVEPLVNRGIAEVGSLVRCGSCARRASLSS